jgi:hypothetical protein
VINVYENLIQMPKTIDVAETETQLLIDRLLSDWSHFEVPSLWGQAIKLFMAVIYECYK